MIHKISEVIDTIIHKHKDNNKICIIASQVLKKTSNEKSPEESFDVNIDEMVSLIHPERYDFNRTKVDPIEVEVEK